MSAGSLEKKAWLMSELIDQNGQEGNRIQL